MAGEMIRARAARARPRRALTGGESHGQEQVSMKFNGKPIERWSSRANC